MPPLPVNIPKPIPRVSPTGYSQPLLVRTDTNRSSCLSKVEIKAPTQGASAVTLSVTFRPSGRTYHYHGVPQQVAFDILSAVSIGQYYNFSIKGQYRRSGPY